MEILNAARVERVVHTGDITQAKVLDELAKLECPVHGVYGNNDLERESLARNAATHGMLLVDPPLELEWASRRILVVHDPRLLEKEQLPDHALALHGHTHRHCESTRNGTRVFNPGECAGMIPSANAVGVVDLATLSCELLRF